MLSDYAPYIIAGLVAGSLYGLAATGLVLTYKTSGIFNFAHGAVGAAAAYVFYDLKDSQGVPAVLAALIVVAVLAPAFGLVLSLLAGHRAEASTAKRVVATVGVLLLVQGALTIRYGAEPKTVAPALPSSTFKLLGVYVGYDQVITTILAVLLVIALELLFRHTRLGLQMRAVVDNTELIDLAGQAPVAVRAKAWMVGSTFAAISGILLAPTVGLDAIVLTFIVVQAFGAAAVGRFDRTTATFVAGVVIGVVQSLLTAPKVHDNLPFLKDLPGIDQAVPFLVLFGVLVLTKRGSLRERPQKRAPRAAVALPARTRGALGVAGIALGIVLPLAYHTKLPVFTIGAVFITISASLFLLLEVSNQVSLCHVAFVAIGATTFSHISHGQGAPWLVGVIAAGLIAAPVGALVAIPAIRLSGAFLALATLSFGILVEKLLYTRQFMFGARGVVTGDRPHLFGLDGNRAYYYLCLAVGIGALLLVRGLQRSRLGRLLSGLAESPVALATHGASINITRVLVFAISAFLAGVAGALDVGVSGSLSSVGASASALISFNSLLWLSVLAFVGRSTIVSPVVAAFFLVVGPSYNSNPHITQYLTVLFGVVAVVVSAFGDGATRWMITAAERGMDRVRRSPVRTRTLAMLESARG